MVSLDLKYDKKDLYGVLGIERSASKSQIKSAYRKLAKQFHPDFNDHINAEEVFRDISFAYQILSDDTKRSNYDKYGFKGINGPTVENFIKDIDDIFESTKITDADLEDLMPKKKRARKFRKSERTLLDLYDEKEKKEEVATKSPKFWWKKFSRAQKKTSKTAPETINEQTTANSNESVDATVESSQASSPTEQSFSADYTSPDESVQAHEHDSSTNADINANDVYESSSESNSDDAYESSSESYVDTNESNNEDTYNSSSHTDENVDESSSDTHESSDDYSSASYASSPDESLSNDESSVSESVVETSASSEDYSSTSDSASTGADYSSNESTTSSVAETTGDSSEVTNTTDETSPAPVEKSTNETPIIVSEADQKKEETKSSEPQELEVNSTKKNETSPGEIETHPKQDQVEQVTLTPNVVTTPTSEPAIVETKTDTSQTKETDASLPEKTEIQSTESKTDVASISTPNVVTPAVDQTHPNETVKPSTTQETPVESPRAKQVSASSPTTPSISVPCVVSQTPVVLPIKPIAKPINKQSAVQDVTSLTVKTESEQQISSRVKQPSTSAAYFDQTFEKNSSINSVFQTEPLDLSKNPKDHFSSNTPVDDLEHFVSDFLSPVHDRFSQDQHVSIKSNGADAPRNTSPLNGTSPNDNFDITDDLFAPKTNVWFREQSGKKIDKNIFFAPEVSSEVDVVVEIKIPQLVLYVGDTKDLVYSRKVRCNACRQNRLTGGSMCDVCGGSGVVNETVKIAIKLPITEQSFISRRFFGFGNASAKNDFVGDLIVNFRAEPLSRFFSADESGNLHTVLHVDALKINLERYLKIPTLNKMIKIRMKEISADEQISIDGYGLDEHYSEKLKRNLPAGKLIVDLVFEFCNYNVNKSMRVNELIKLNNPRVEKFEKEIEQELKTMLAIKNQSHSWNDFIDKTTKSE